MNSIWYDRALKDLKILNDAKSDLIKCDRSFENVKILIDAKSDLIMMRSNFLKILRFWVMQRMIWFWCRNYNKSFHKLNNWDTKMYKYNFHKLNNKK